MLEVLVLESWPWWGHGAAAVVFFMGTYLIHRYRPEEERESHYFDLQEVHRKELPPASQGGRMGDGLDWSDVDEDVRPRSRVK